MLADCLAMSFPTVEQDHLNWDYRKALFPLELLASESNFPRPSIFTLEEVDHPDEILAMLGEDFKMEHI